MEKLFLSAIILLSLTSNAIEYGPRPPIDPIEITSFKDQPKDLWLINLEGYNHIKDRSVSIQYTNFKMSGETLLAWIINFYNENGQSINNLTYTVDNGNIGRNDMPPAEFAKIYDYLIRASEKCPVRFEFEQTTYAIKRVTQVCKP